MQLKKLILGMGATGISVADFFLKHKIDFDICDESDKNLTQLQAKYPQANLFLLGKDKQTQPQAINMQAYDAIIASPGVDLNKNHLALVAKSLAIPIIGDLELFAQNAKAPIIGITGSNGKSTVTSLVGEIFSKAGFNVGLGGNLGKPALELLDDAIDYYILELSSFQLDTSTSLKLETACILNITPDHLDRHLSMANYINIKQKIYANAKNIVYFREDKNTYPQAIKTHKDLTNLHEKPANTPDSALSAIEVLASFGLDFVQEAKNYSLDLAINSPQGSQAYNRQIADSYICENSKKIIASKELSLLGKIGILNSMASLAICDSCNIDRSISLASLTNFIGLDHRCKKVIEKNNISYYNDSKATNVAAALAGVENIASMHANILLILGGEGKNQDFAPLLDMQNIKAIAIFGKDKQLISQTLKHKFTSKLCTDLPSCINWLESLATKGDALLLSPACASLDMFANYQQRGKEFEECVLQTNHKALN